VRRVAQLHRDREIEARPGRRRDAIIATWAPAAEAFRAGLGQRARLDVAYGPAPRNRLDLFLPEEAPRGLAVFVHGGYWMAFDKSAWSHLAAGALAAGWAVALPSYTLAPEARLAGITQEIAAAIAHAATLVPGPIRLAGHSAGGHLVSRMACDGAPLDAAVRARLAHVLSISGVHDLRPLRATQMNGTLRIDAAEARAESPALLDPVPAPVSPPGSGRRSGPSSSARPTFSQMSGPCPVSPRAPTTTPTATTST
jgi:arylformamidase